MGFVWFEVWLGSSRLLLLVLRSRQEITYTVWLDLFADGCVARFLQPATRLLGARALPSTKICCAISCKPYFLTAPYLTIPCSRLIGFRSFLYSSVNFPTCHLAVLVIEKNAFTTVAARHHMIPCAFALDSDGSGHGRCLSGLRQGVKFDFCTLTPVPPGFVKPL
jgi:hypothetical protein